MGSHQKGVIVVAESLQLPKIDFSGLDPSNPGGDRWDAVRGQVMQALESYSSFDALYGRVSPELREAIFSRAIPEFFNLPFDVKKRWVSDLPKHGYLHDIPGMVFEAVIMENVTSLDGADRFTRLMWPQGNSFFSETVCTYAKLLMELEQIIERMVLQSMGIEKYYDSRVRSTNYGLQLSQYGIPLDKETKMAMSPHLDMDLMTIVCQNQGEGLEVQTKDGEWIHVVSSPNSFTVMLGEAFGAWTNGRLQPACHRVKITGKEKRYTTIFSSEPRDGYLVQAPEELIDEGHPLLYMPYNFNDYMRFRFSKEGDETKNDLKAFCGVMGLKV